MFICYKSGYKDLSDDKKERYCSICGTDKQERETSMIKKLNNEESP